MWMSEEFLTMGFNLHWQKRSISEFSHNSKMAAESISNFGFIKGHKAEFTKCKRTKIVIPLLTR